MIHSRRGYKIIVPFRWCCRCVRGLKARMEEEEEEEKKWGGGQL